MYLINVVFKSIIRRSYF